MKTITLSVFAILFTVLSHARTGNPIYAYGEVGGGAGTHSLFKIGANAIVNNKHTFSCHIINFDRVSPNTPSDYDPHFDLFGDGMPHEMGLMVCLQYGRIFNTSIPSLRFGLKGGVSIGTIYHPENFRDHVSSWGVLNFSSNYDYDDVQSVAPGLVLNPVVEFPLSHVFGISIGAHANINHISPMVAFEGSLIVGHLRDRIKRSNKQQDGGENYR